MSGKPRFLPPHQKSVIKTRRPSFSPLSVFWEEKSEILEGKSGKYCIIAKILFSVGKLGTSYSEEGQANLYFQ